MIRLESNVTTETVWQSMLRSILGTENMYNVRKMKKECTKLNTGFSNE